MVECNRQAWTLDKEIVGYPYFQAAVGEVNPGDTIEAYYYRIREQYVGDFNNDIKSPLEYREFFGMLCPVYRDDAIYDYDMMCSGGEVNIDEPAYFFSCYKDNSVPFPGCSDTFVFRGLTYHLSYNKKCAPIHRKIRQRAINFVEAARKSGEE